MKNHSLQDALRLHSPGNRRTSEFRYMKTIDKHARILTAAIKTFAKKGFFSARISDIAKEAKVADGTIYLYFNNKADILLSVFEKEIGAMIRQVQRLLAAEADPAKMLEIFITRHLAVMKKNKSLAKVIQVELRRTDKLITKYRDDEFSRYIDIIANIITLGQEQNVFRQDIQPEIAKRAFLGALDELSRVWGVSLETNYTVEEIAHQVTTMFLTGLSVQSASKR